MQKKNRLKALISIGLAYFFLIMACLGVVLPILPTTPFLLLSIYLFIRSSPKGAKMILRNRVLAPYVLSYFSKKGIPTNILLRTLLLLWGLLALSGIVFTQNIYLRILFVVIGFSVSIHLIIRSKFYYSRKDYKKANELGSK